MRIPWKKDNERIKILALDGGTHGFTWLLCLREIEEDNPGFLAETDVFTGSSFGGFCSLYFARHMGSLERGQSALALIDGCVAFMKELLYFVPDQAAFDRLREGREAMYSHDDMEKVLTDPKHLGDSCLGDLHRRVILSTCGTKRPSWYPKVYDNLDEADQKVRCSEVALESSALPIFLPTRNGLANGSLGGTNGSLHGLTHVVGADQPVPLEDIVLLSLGSDALTSSLANTISPWEGGEPVPRKLSFDAILQPKPEHAQALAMLEKKMAALWKDLETHTKHTPAGATGKAPYGAEPMHAHEVAASPEKGSMSWGWRQWLLYEPSPLFFYQVVTNNQVLDAARQVQLLLGERAFRLAPSALLNYGQILFMTFLGNAEASDTIFRVAELTAELWADPESSRAFEFKPTVDETEAFIDTQWMPQNKPMRSFRERLSGWRRMRSG